MSQTFIMVPEDSYNNLNSRIDNIERLLLQIRSTPAPPEDDYIDAIETMKLLGIGKKAIKEFEAGGKRPVSKKLTTIRKSGDIKFRKVGREYQYLRSDVINYTGHPKPYQRKSKR